MGSPSDLKEMLGVAARHNRKAVTESFAMDEAHEAIAKVKKNQVRYRAVLFFSRLPPTRRKGSGMLPRTLLCFRFRS
jgi:hypothetical protein